MTIPFLQLKRSRETEELIKDPACFVLLTQIAYRARRTDEFNILDLKPGEALIGDFRSIGLTEQKYRTAKEKLKKWKFATFKSTNKGTIATLLDTRVFDINIELSNNQNNRQTKDKQRANNEQVTTNNNDNKDKNYKNEKEIEEVQSGSEKPEEELCYSGRLLNSFSPDDFNSYGFYKNIFLSKEQYNSLITNDKISKQELKDLIEELSQNVADKKELAFDGDQNHYSRLRAYWKYKRRHPDKFSNEVRGQNSNPIEYEEVT